jgi:hypothetical protein
MPKILKSGKNAGITDDIKNTIQNAISSIIIPPLPSSNKTIDLHPKHDDLILDTTDQDDDKKKRRGRKPKDKFAFDDVALSRTDTLPENDNNIVIKIPINYMELDKEFNISGDIFAINTPKPFERLTTDSSYKFLNDGDGSNNPHTIGTGVTLNSQLSQFSLTGEPVNKRETDYTVCTGSLAQCNGTTVPRNYRTHGMGLELSVDGTGLGFNGMDSASGELFMPQNTQMFATNPSNEIIADLVESNYKKHMTQVEILLEKKYKHTKQISLLSNICVDDGGNTWTAKTQCACYWDCHCFDHQPWGIPTKYNYLTGQFTMFGNFCSPNCAMSYLLTYETNTSALWEKISLLNLLYYKVYENDDNIIPAPDKICIKLFGGPFDINEFRALTLKNNKIYNINFPPCNIITPVLEETKKVYNQESYFIPNDKKKHNKIQTELKIKRTRPITTNKNTIDSMLNKLE